jgi:hypothetical protein
MKVLKIAVAVGALAGAAIVGPAALAAGTPAGGPLKVFVTNTSSTKGKILVTGAIGDCGTTLSVDKNGKADPNGAFEKVSLKQGGFWVDATGLNKKLNSAQPQINTANCSVVGGATAPVKLFNGTGAYAGIGGTVKITVTFAAILPRKNGKCNFANSAQPVSQYQSITGSGSASFS